MIELLKSFDGRWAKVEPRAVFKITGPDRVRYLNGQVTNDVSRNLDEKAVAACLCTLKGKVEALVWISATKDALIVDGEHSQRETIFNRLDRYLIADDCELSDETEQMSLVHHFMAEAEGVISDRVGLPGKDLWLDSEEIPPEFPDTKKIRSSELTAAGILGGVPRAGYEISGDQFPAELGLDRWAVDFHKGCYLGQEIVSRIESVGRVKRGLRALKAQNSDPIGAKIVNSAGEKGEITGPFEQIEEKLWVSFGLFSLNSESAEIADFEPVSYSLR